MLSYSGAVSGGERPSANQPRLEFLRNLPCNFGHAHERSSFPIHPSSPPPARRLRCPLVRPPPRSRRPPPAPFRSRVSSALLRAPRLLPGPAPPPRSAPRPRRLFQGLADSAGCCPRRRLCPLDPFSPSVLPAAVTDKVFHSCVLVAAFAHLASSRRGGWKRSARSPSWNGGVGSPGWGLAAASSPARLPPPLAPHRRGPRQPYSPGAI